MIVRRSVSLVLVFVFVEAAAAQEIGYRVSIPEPEHHWMHVEATFSDARAPLEVRMSRSSPGRYALHEFAKNVYDVRAYDAAGEPLPVRRADPYGWVVEASGTVRVAYKVFGDQVDGTYLSVDSTHAHINMPAAFVWARGMTDRPIRVSFDLPGNAQWTIASQLFPTTDPRTFTAPNLQYFMDSPTELGPIWQREFRVRQPDGAGDATFRIALHHAGAEDDGTRYAEGLAKIAAEAGAVFGEFPSFEPGFYMFLADYLPGASGDGMEHRNSTVVTGPNGLGDPHAARQALGTAAHELFHAWNVERVRPASLEPFDFERANMSGELWLAEGFTSYYGPLLMHRAGLAGFDVTLPALEGTINAIVNGPGRRVRTAVEMSEMAPFVDAARSVDPTNFDITFISYYTWGAGIALALDLSLRDLPGGRLTLDDYMRAMWRTHGKPEGAAAGLVSQPYTLADARARLAEVSGDAQFADAFFSRYVEGHDAPDYARLLHRAGLVVRRRHPGRGWMGDLALQPDSEGLRIARPTAPGSPVHDAGLDVGDVVLAVGGRRIVSESDVTAAVAVRKPGDSLAVQFRRRGTASTATTDVRLGDDPELEILTVESSGGKLSAAQQAFRAAWLGSRVTAYHKDHKGH